jgi:uncharacterized protein YndB with AHSA1/START domain
MPVRNALFIVLFVASPLLADSARRIEREAIVTASRAEVWRAWSSSEGAKTFFAQDAKIELRSGGAYEIYFNLGAPAGERGGETNQVVAFEPETMLLFSWNAPPKFGPLRHQHTYVLLRLDDAPGGGTRVRLTHFGWRDGDEWTEVYDYFDRAWSFVMDNFRKAYDRSALAAH